jgi:hypothetical protein
MRRTSRAERGTRLGKEYMKLTWRKSGRTFSVSPVSSAPWPRATCSTDAPGKCPPQRTSVIPSPSSFVSPSQNSIAGSGRITHSRSSAWR